MPITGKRYGQLERAGASPSFSSSYHSCGEHRKISIGVTVQESLAGIGSELKKNGEFSDPRAGSLVGSKNKQENINQANLVNGQIESSIQKAGAWVSRSFHKDIKTVSLYANGATVVQSIDGMAKKIDYVTYTRKCKNTFNPENVEEFVFAATQEMHVSKKSNINCEMVTEENGHIQTKQHTESLRTKLWDILQTVPSHPDDRKADTVKKPKQSSDTIESDSEKPIKKSSKPIIHLASQRKPTKKFPKLLNKSNIYQFRPSPNVEEKLPQQNVFAFTGEEADGAYAVALNSNSSGFKKKHRKKRNLIKPMLIQYSPKAVAEKEHGKNAQKGKQQHASPLRSLPLPQEPLVDKCLRSPVKEVKDDAREVLDIPMVRNGDEKEQQDVSTTLPRDKICGKGISGSLVHRFDAETLESSPISIVAGTKGEGFHSSRKCGGDNKQLETSETNKESFYICKKSGGEKNQLDISATKKDNFDYSRKCDGNNEELETGGTMEENIQNPPLHDDSLGHVSPEIPENMIIRKVFLQHQRRSHACVASSDGTTEDKETLSRTPSSLGRRKVDKNFSSSAEEQNIGCTNHQVAKGETLTVEGHQKPLFLLRRNIRVRHQANIPKVPIYTSTKGKEESLPLHLESPQNEDTLASAIVQFASGLERFKMKMKSHTKRKTSDIISSTTEKIQAQLHNAESQLHMELEKLACLSKAKRKKLETRFQEQQERLKAIHSKFKEDVSVHIQECMNVLGEMEANQTELRAIAERQKASHKKLLLQVQEEIATGLGDAERRIGALNKEARRKMQQLKQALSGAF